MKKTIEVKTIDGRTVASMIEYVNKAKKIAKKVAEKGLNVEEINVMFYDNGVVDIDYSIIDTDMHVCGWEHVLLTGEEKMLFYNDFDYDADRDELNYERTLDYMTDDAVKIGLFEFDAKYELRLNAVEFGNLFVKEEVDLTPIEKDDIPF